MGGGGGGGYPHHGTKPWLGFLNVSLTANNPSGESKFAPNHSLGVLCARCSSWLFVLYFYQFCSGTIFTENTFLLPFCSSLPQIFIYLDLSEALLWDTVCFEFEENLNRVMQPKRIFNWRNAHMSASVYSEWASHTMRTLSTAVQTWDITASCRKNKRYCPWQISVIYPHATLK